MISHDVNIPAILIANGMGIVILVCVAICNAWRFKNPTREDKAVIAMFLVTFTSCIVEPISFLLDGRSGIGYTILLTITNTWTYVTNILYAASVLLLISVHMGYKLSRVHRIIVLGALSILGLLLIVNIFYPLVFSLENNQYERAPGYFVYMVVEALIALDATVLGIYVQVKSGKQKFFPVLAFILPSILGAIIQTLVYGISTVFPFYAISVCCIMICLQNEVLFRDRLTGLYNRYYLEQLGKRMVKQSNEKFTSLMLDINGFKGINDNYGHNEGDRALCAFAEVLEDVVKEDGIVVRYAGDEFIIIISGSGEEVTQRIESKIHQALHEYNDSHKNPYSLSVAIGSLPIDYNDCDDIDAFLDRIDKLMYQDKSEYYHTHREYDRRKPRPETSDE